MATIAQPAGPKAKAERQPLSAHPAFPFIVALWFAALLGIGSLLVPVILIENLLDASGIAALVPQAAPPLGITARLLVALGTGVVGGLLGLTVARRVAASHRAPAPSRLDRMAPVTRRPIAAHDELGAEGLDGTTPRGRRALAIAEEEGPSEVFELAPLPGGRIASALSPMQTGADDFVADWADVPEEDDTLELSAILETEASDAQPGFTSFSAEAPVAPSAFEPATFEPAPLEPAMSDRQMFTPPAAAVPELNDKPEAVMPAPRPDLHFSPPSLARQPVQEWNDEAEEEAVDEPQAFAAAPMPQEYQPQDQAQDFAAVNLADHHQQGADPVAAASEHPAQWQHGELDDLGMVQLAQRLGSSIARRREARAQQALREAEDHARALAEARAQALAEVQAQVQAPVQAPVAAPHVAPVIPAMPNPSMLADDEDMAAPDDAAQAMAAYFGGASAAAPAAAPVAQADGAAAQEPEALAAPANPVAFAAPAAEPAGDRQMFRPVTPAAPQPAATLPLAKLAPVAIDYDDPDGEDHDDFGTLTASFSLPLARPQAAPAPAPLSFAAPAPEAAVADEAEPDFAAVLAARNPFQQRSPAFVRIEDEPQALEGAVEPAVVFPGARPLGTAPASFAPPQNDFSAPARGDSEEHQRALREALLNLQRMSGAA